MIDRKFLSVELPVNMKAKFEALCLAENRSMSEQARLVIAHLVDGHSATWVGREEPEPDSSRMRLEVRLSCSELCGMRRVAAQSGMSTNRWLVALARAYLTHEPQFGMEELAAIGESTKALAALGRNLNQAAHALNQGHSKTDLVPVLEGLQAQIQPHIKSVAALVQANVNRWRITWQRA